ncbi:MAG: 1-acyl-sn-glycerol-3-phosphate acyltransferase, partial [Cyclobacteriaceae bacterium]
EIAGNFKQSRYRLARTIISFGFARLLNATRIKGLKALVSTELDLPDKIHVVGEAEQLRSLAKLGTVVLVPTHFSNLDSVLIGWVIQHLGLPPFIYGAGLNLFNIGIFAYFMDSLGAYKVDRRKKNNLYLQTLKTYSTEALKYGCHSLFFPGGTRSRSGKIEEKLKMGLLGTALEAQRLNFVEHPDKAGKIFVVPMVLNYHFVLEAPSLIREHLTRHGQERFYQESDEFSTSYKIIKFLFKFFARGSGISVSIGKGMDLLGNYVNEQGESIDQHGRVVNTRHYFSSQGAITKDPQRDFQYTEILGDRIVEEYHKINRVFSSHLVAFAAFQLLRKQYKKLDLFNFLRLSVEEQTIDYKSFRNSFEKLRDKVFSMYEEGKVQVAAHLTGDIDAVIDHGLFNVGLYHAKRPLLKSKEGKIVTQDLNTLYFYHNRLSGYGLENEV